MIYDLIKSFIRIVDLAGPIVVLSVFWRFNIAGSERGHSARYCDLFANVAAMGTQYKPISTLFTSTRSDLPDDVLTKSKPTQPVGQYQEQAQKIFVRGYMHMLA